MEGLGVDARLVGW